MCNVATQTGGKSFVDHNKRMDVGLILFTRTLKKLKKQIICGQWVLILELPIHVFILQGK